MAIRIESVRQDHTMHEPRYKRPFDLAVLIAAHVLLAPLWAILWALVPLAIKLDDGGPVFYSQTRMGRDGKPFTVRKFRSMVTDAEKGTGAVWAGRNDPRITRVGRILRHTALDELPQVLNVWKGEMSFVGPRPERPDLHRRFTVQTPGFDKRLSARPGMAGMAQVYGRYDLSPPEKLKYDLQYINSMSLLLDIKLLVLAAINSVLARWGRAAGGGVPVSGQTVMPPRVVPFTPAPDAAADERHDADEEMGKAA